MIKDGVEVCKELAKVDLNKFKCNNNCSYCVFWSGYCMANLVKGIIQKSNKYLEDHKE